MKASEAPQYFLLWKGEQSGPFSLAEIRAKLDSGGISRMHQVNFDGRWIVLDEFLQKQGGTDLEVGIRAQAEKREAELRSNFEQQIAVERAHQSALEAQIAQAENRSSHARLLPPQPSILLQHLHSRSLPGLQIAPVSAPPRTSGLAIAALVAALCSFVPYVGFITWIPALVFGHVALSQTKRDPALVGGGMAIAALVITYFLLAIGLIVVLLVVANN